MSELTRVEIRRRLAEIASELRELPPDEVARHRELMAEARPLRESSEEMARRALETARKRWAEQAGRKGSHTVDPLHAKARIASPISWGG